MRLFILALVALVTVSAQATPDARGFLESPTFDKLCDGAVLNDGGGSYSMRRPSFAESETSVFAGIASGPNGSPDYVVYRISKADPTQTAEVARVQAVVYDILLLQNAMWLLERDRLISVDLATGKTRELAFQDQAPIHNYDHAYDMESLGSDKIVIADGVVGLKVIDAKQMTVERTIDLGLAQANGHKSLAVSIAKVSGETMFVGVDNLTLPAGEAFNGLIDVNVAGGSYLKYPYRQGVLSQVSKLRYANGAIWINNWGILQYASVASIRKSKSVGTAFLQFGFQAEGKSWTAEPLGEFFIVGSDFFACGMRSEVMTTKPSPKIGIPLRKSLTTIAPAP